MISAARQAGVDRRNDAVLEVLRRAVAPMGPTEIARQIAEPWCHRNGYPQSAPITPILRRIGAVRHANGKWSAPEGI